MKRIISMLTCVSIVASMTACGDNAVEEKSEDIQESVVLEETIDTQENSQSESTGENITDTLDLTSLSSTMLYAEMYYMMLTPEDYADKTIILKGQFAAYEDVENDQMYYGCLVIDETGCCVQGIDFVPSSDLSYPDDFPEIGEEITVSGTFTIHYESGYCNLTDAVIS